MLEKFGGDSLAETRDNLERYRERISRPPELPSSRAGASSPAAAASGEAGSGGDD